MREPEHHDHHVSHERYDELKAEYCRRCGMPMQPGDAAHAHAHDDETDHESAPEQA